MAVNDRLAHVITTGSSGAALPKATARAGGDGVIYHGPAAPPAQVDASTTVHERTRVRVSLDVWPTVWLEVDVGATTMRIALGVAAARGLLADLSTAVALGEGIEAGFIDSLGVTA